MKRQPRAKSGSGGNAPSMKGKDPRASRSRPTVGEDVALSRLFQRLEELPETADTAELRTALNLIVRALRGEETT